MPGVSLRGWLPAWDFERRRVDLSEVRRWTFSQLRAWGCEDVEALSDRDAQHLAQRLTAQSLSPTLRKPLHEAMRVMLPELPWKRIWVQTHAHFRILTVGDRCNVVPPHTDFGFGHGLDERNLWLPLTDAMGAAALHGYSLDRSLAWPAATEGIVDAPDLVPQSTPRDEALLFTPLHVHGGRSPVAAPRLSIDLRIIPAGGRANYTFSPLWRNALRGDA
ncbi:MAG: hypothetical protein AAGE52_04410 [Myxococcota bacterium]